MTRASAPCQVHTGELVVPGAALDVDRATWIPPQVHDLLRLRLREEMDRAVEPGEVHRDLMD